MTRLGKEVNTEDKAGMLGNYLWSRTTLYKNEELSPGNDTSCKGA